MIRQSCGRALISGAKVRALTDGRYAACLLDRNGLRPARWVKTRDGFITLASEIGTYAYKTDAIMDNFVVLPK